MKNYDELWKALDIFILGYRRKGGLIPQDIVEDLKSVKTMISIYQMEPSSVEIITNIESLLNRIEVSLLYLAETNFGKEYAEDYSRKILEAKTRENDELIPPSGYTMNIPRWEHYVRFRLTGIMERKDVDDLAKILDLICDWKNADSVTVHGDKQRVLNFIQIISDKTRRSRESNGDTYSLHERPDEFLS